MTTFAFYSMGGFARETVAGFILSQGMAAPDDQFDVIFIDDNPDVQGEIIHGHRVVSYEEARGISDLRVNIAFADPNLRRKYFEKCENDDIKIFSSFATTSIIGTNVKIGNGAIFSHNTIVTCDAWIGKSFHCNIYSYVAHDCIIGDYVTLAPRVSLNGRIKVEDDVYIGSDATFLPGKRDKFLTIGRGAIIGAGAVVTRDVEPGAVMVGSPAKPRT